MPGSGIDKIQKDLKDEYVSEKTKLKNTLQFRICLWADLAKEISH